MSESKRPLVSMITINYNSMKKINVILACLKSMLETRWRPLQLICVDNGSTDGSFDEVQKFAKSNSSGDIDLVFLPLGFNAGFARANNEGLQVASISSKFVAIINNDMAPDPGSLEKLVSFLESDPRVAAVQPIVMNWDDSRIDSAGGILSYWGAGSVAFWLDFDAVSQPFYVSHVYGAYSVYRREAIEKSGGLFLSDFFMYGDDYELGIRLWAHGYKLVALPIHGGRHYRSATAGGFKNISYLAIRNETAVLVMYSGAISFLVLMRTLGILTYDVVSRNPLKTRAFVDGLLFGLKLRKSLPRNLRNSLRFVPRPPFSFVDWAFMHSHLRSVASFQRRLAKKILDEFHL